MSLPYYKRFPRDFLDGTIGLSLEVKGAYAVVLDLIYMRGGRLPDDGRYISGQLGCSLRKWNAIRSELLERGKLTVELGFISNFRADYLIEETRKLRDKNAENGSKSKENKDLPKRTPPDTRAGLKSDTEPESDIEDKSSISKRAKPFPDDWQPTEEDRAYGTAQGLSPEEVNRAVEDFRDYFIAAGPSRKSTNWSLNWKRWCRTSADRTKQRGSGSSRQSAASGNRQEPVSMAGILARKRGYT